MHSTPSHELDLDAPFTYDARRFSQHSGGLEGRIMMEIHRLEKWLTLTARRPVSAQRASRRLRAYLEQCPNSGFNAHALSVIKACGDAFGELGGSSPTTSVGGIDEISPPGPWEGFGEFARGRHSVREFAAGEVEDETIRDAVRIAQAAPSVCNRQATVVHVFRPPFDHLLALQNGNRGFRNIGLLLLVTSDLRRFQGLEERHQPWLDGGLFTMLLVLALHSKGLGTCLLNWCVLPDQDVKLRKAAPLPDHEQPLTMLAVGHLSECYRVTRPTPRALDEVLRFHEGQRESSEPIH